MRLAGRLLIALVGVLVLTISGTYWTIEHDAPQILADQAVDAGLSPDTPTTGVTATTTTTTTAPNGSTTQIAVYPAENILLVGGDSRSGEGNNIDNIDDSNGRTATDTMILIHISGDRQHIYAMSMPRDMWAPNVHCDTYNRTTGTYGNPVAANTLTRQHLNSFYGVGGPKCLVDAIENLTQLTINRYVQIDFAGFKTMVDALGGVTVNACQPIIDTHLGTILPTAGEQTINGTQALTLARARHVTTDNGLSDLARVRRQQVLLAAILREVSTNGTLLDPAALNAFFTAFSTHTVTDNVDLTTLIELANSVGNLNPSTITFLTMPTIPDTNDTTGRGSLLIDHPTTDPIFEAFRNDQPAPITIAGTPETPPATTAPTTPSGLRAPNGTAIAIAAAAPVVGTPVDCL